ncbi:SRPBCC family protein [Chondromyces apiculatus]|uniref:Cell division inhibitor n=1 Tax=Chondromyces apiculatus DSM 436 TaxID=1192034 RepID=A0A017T3Y7_9BACT|nr:SRPBCC family protein [Chondromyces apiculatus]EYF03702.1 Cell division inhibitor [Chondromyces apiculatus DSM 436]
MPTFEKRTRIAATPEQVFAFHEAPDALERLTPPWEEVRIVEKSAGIGVGARVVMDTRLGPLWMRWVAEHTRYEKGRMFQDVQISGPFRRWEHTHQMDPDGEGGCWLVDHVEYALPVGALGALVAGRMVRRKLERMFDYRHELTQRICEGQR